MVKRNNKLYLGIAAIIILAVIGTLFASDKLFAFYSTEIQFQQEFGNYPLKANENIFGWAKTEKFICDGEERFGFMCYGFGNYCDTWDNQCNKYFGVFENQYVRLEGNVRANSCNPPYGQSLFAFKTENMKIEFEVIK